MPPSSIDIIMFNMSAFTDWQHGIANRNMYILRSLLADQRVRKIVAVDYLPFTFKRTIRQWFQNILGGPSGQVISRGFGYKLTALSNSELEKIGIVLPSKASNSEVQHKLFVFSTVLSWRNERKLYEILRRQINRLNLKNIVNWSYLPTFVGYFGSLGERLNVFDAVDNWLEHSSYVAVKDRLKVNYQTIRSKANLIFTTSQDLTKLFDLAEGCSYIPNGVDYKSIETAPKLTDRDIAILPRPIIGYIGTIQEDRVDIDLVSYLAKANPQKSFVLIGGVWPGLRKQVIEKLRPLSNVHLLGRKSFKDRPQYLQEFDVAIIPHKMNEFNRHTNPMKLYEYLAVGCPVVATPGAGLEEFKDLIYLAAKPEDFNSALIKALEEDDSLVQKRKQVAKNESWDERVNMMMTQILDKMSN